MKQWYEINPELLEIEKIAMSKAFPHFKLEKLDDGHLCWVGDITLHFYLSDIEDKKEFTVMVIYQNNHPQHCMGSTVRVYPLLPDYDDLCNKWGFHMIPLRPESNPYAFCSQILRDSDDNLFIGTWINNRSEEYIRTAAAELRMFECWLQISECLYAMRANEPSFYWSWDKMIEEFPFLSQYIEERISFNVTE